MEKIKNIYCEYKRIVLWCTVACVIIFGYFIVFDRPFALNNDQVLQYRFFYEEWFKLIKNFIKTFQLPLYSWNSFLGTDFYSSMAYYVTGDIFVPFGILFRNVDTFLFLESIVCIYISGISMNLFLREFGIKNKEIRNWISICYALSGFSTLFIGQYMFHRFYAFMPLLFFGIEKYYNNGNGIYFSLSVFVLFLQNYYLMFPLSILLPLYCIFSLKYKGIVKITEILKNALYLILYYILGFFMSAFITIPGMIYLLGNDRVGNYSFNFSLFEPQVYIGLLINWGSHFLERAIFNNIYICGESGHMSFYSLYFGSLPFLGMLSLIFSKDIKKYWIIVIPFVFLCFPFTNSIVHGFSEPTLRWSFIVLFFACLLSALFFDGQQNQKSLKKSMIVYLVLCCLTLLLGMLGGLVDLSLHKEHLIAIVIYSIIMYVSYSIYIKSHKLSQNFTIITLILSSFFIIYFLNSEFYYYEDDLNIETIRYIKETDDDLMYRYYVDTDILLPTSPINLNQSTHYDFMSFTTYNTMYEPVIKDFLEYNDIYWHIIKLDNQESHKLLGAKYYIVYDEDDIIDDFNFEYKMNINHLQVYENKDFRGFAYTYNKFIHKSEFEANINLSLMNDYLVVPDDFDYGEYLSEGTSSSIKMNIEWVQTNSMKGNIDIDNKTILFISVPNNKGWTVFVNGKKVETISVNGGFIGLALDEIGLNEVEMYFISPGLKQGFAISASAFMVMIILCKKFKHGKM